MLRLLAERIEAARELGLVREPLRSEIPVICKESLVVEFYSR